MRVFNSSIQSAVSFVLLVLIALWFLYLAYKIAVHVQAWPFG